MHNSVPTDAIFMDLSKEFDRVQHKRLLAKVRNLQLDEKNDTMDCRVPMQPTPISKI